MQTPFPHRRAIVTGGSRGIGLAIATALRAEGVEVVVCGRDPHTLDDALREVPGLHGLVADLGRAGARADFLEQATEQLGGLDLLVHCAGIQRAVDWTHVGHPDEAARELARELEIDLVAPLHLTRLAAPALIASGGTVVFVSSILGATPKACAPAYCAAKAGIRSACVSLRAQLAPVGVSVVDLVPPVVDTHMTAGRAGDRKLTPAEVGASLIAGLRAGRDTVAPGPAALALRLHRWAPGLLRRAVLHQA
ncbi:MAG: SDR family NAD(P)-dependent oxidoreductase [Alphaproteobacteria bacterium]|nr:SDR family NAD(P)-dependent oxidoreductase [Alphaproteobacteria bacterium]